jgi:cytochrome P450
VSVPFNPFDPDFVRDPYPTYAALRREEPVKRIEIGWRRGLGMLLRLLRTMGRRGMLKPTAMVRFARARARHRRGRKPVHTRPGLRSRMFAVSRYEEVSFVLRTPEIFSSEIMGGSQTEIMNAEGDIAPTSGALIAQDPPEHTRQRGIVNRGFTPRRIAALEPRIRANAEELFARFEHTGECDLMEQFANPLPVSVIADLLGLDPARRDDFKRWSTALIVGSTQAGDGFGANVELFREFRGYMSGVIEDRRANPGDDLLSTLIHSGEDEGILEPEQVISFATLLLAAGSETTTNLIGNAMLALFEHPDQLERLQAEPKLVDRLVEESLRYDPPIQLVMRLATRDTELGGVRIPRRSIIAVLLASANRDESQFESADRFDIDRSDGASHMGFGFGNHYCIGAALAKLEGTIALEMILTRLRGIELAIDEVPRHGSFLVRGPSTLPVRFDV